VGISAFIGFASVLHVVRGYHHRHGLFVGLILLLLIVGGLAYYLGRRRSRRKPPPPEDDGRWGR
jgi:hypothetical protein